MKKFILLIGLLFSLPSFSQTRVERLRANVNPPTQAMLETLKLTPLSEGSVLILDQSGVDSSTASTVVSTFSAQPDVPRALLFTPGGSTGAIKEGNIIITGQGFHGQILTEELAVSDNQSSPLTSSTAFARVNSISFPAQEEGLDGEWSVNVSERLGLSGCLDGSGYLIKGLIDGVALNGEVLNTSETNVGLNWIVPIPRPNGSRSYDIMFVHNMACLGNE